MKINLEIEKIEMNSNTMNVFPNANVLDKEIKSEEIGYIHRFNGILIIENNDLEDNMCRVVYTNELKIDVIISEDGIKLINR